MRRLLDRLGRGGGWLGTNLLLYLPFLAVALIAYAIATDQEFTAHEILVSVIGFFMITLPGLAVYLLVIWALARRVSRPAARVAAVVLSPAIFLFLYGLAESDDTGALTIVLTLGLPALAYGLVVRLPSGPAGARRPRPDTPRGRPRAA